MRFLYVCSSLLLLFPQNIKVNKLIGFGENGGCDRNGCFSSSSIPDFIKHISYNYLERITKTMEIIVQSDGLETHLKQRDIINEIVEKVESIAIRIHAQTILEFTGSMDLIFIICESATAFKKISLDIHQKKHDYMGKYLIYITESPTSDSLETGRVIFSECFLKDILDVIYLVELGNKDIILYTYSVCTEDNYIHSREPEGVGIFSKNRLILSKTNTRSIFPEKLKNFNKCELNICVSFDEPFIIEQNPIRGIEGDLLHLLKSHLNFHIVVDKMNKRSVSQLISLGYYDLAAGGLTFTTDAKYNVTPGKPYYSSTLIIVMPRAKKIGSVRRIFYPMDRYIWLGVILTYIGGALVILQIKKASIVIQKFVFGSRNNTPLLNLLTSLLGNPTTNEPGRNFARFLLISWIYLWLVLRAAYQGNLYHFLRSPQTEPIPKSFSQLVEQNYSIYISRSTYLLLNIDCIKDRVIQLDRSEIDALLIIRRADMKSKIALVTTLDFLNYQRVKERRLFKISILEETISTQSIALRFQKHSFFKHRFDKALMDMTSAGILSKSASLYTKTDNLKKGSQKKKALGYQTLYSCFIIVVMGLIWSSLVFIYEVVINLK